MNNHVWKCGNIYRDEDKLSLAHGGRQRRPSIGLGMDSYYKLFSLLCFHLILARGPDYHDRNNQTAQAKI